MVRLISLQAHNFKKLQIENPIQFSNGITLITGLNESGKSSVLDAILYALFGRVNRPPRAKNEDLIAYGKNEATLGLVFEVGERRFRVSRRINRAKSTRANLDELTSSAAQPLATGQEKVNEEIERLLGGITYNEIVSSTVVAQKELNKLIELNRDDRRKVINAFLNLDSFNVVIDDLVDERRNLEGSSTRLGRLKAEQEKLLLLQSEYEEFQRSYQEKIRLVDENSKLTESATILEGNFNESDKLYSDLRKYESVTKAKDGWVAQLASKKQILNEHLTRKERLNNEIDTTKKGLAKFAAYDQARPVFREIESQLEMARTLSLEFSAAERTWKELDQEVCDLDRKMPSRERVKLEESTAQLSKPVLPYVLLSALLLISALAAFAFQVISAGVILVLAALVPGIIGVTRLTLATSIAKHQSMFGDLRYFNSKSDELSNASKHLAQTKAQLDYMKRGLMKLYTNLPDGLGPATEATALETAQTILESARQHEQSEREFMVKLQTLETETNSLPGEPELNRFEMEIGALQKQIDGIEFPALPVGLTFAPNLLADALNTRDEKARELAAARSRIEQNAKRLPELDRYLSEHSNISSHVQSQEKIVEELDRKLKVTKRAIEAVQATGESLRNRVRPSVQGFMNVVLPALTSSKYRAAMLDEDYNLQVWDPEAGEYRPKEVYSGGTEDQFLLAMRLSFALALMPEVKGQKPEFVFLDEPLGSSDEVRRSGILRYLADDLSRNFKQIFIVSHVSGLEDHVQNTISLDDGKVS